ncbi:FAD-binding oxidoreductase [Cesiribacter andamanensis]|uniref:Putative decaprenylphosphoryl-beta-D-ribose oxidase n=1 Tax=Cesiribacter andamanensis AMV16 TaxID=1279009 RepID=M7N7R2_9BACT|nr:FAD-binding oxidoreductase [Cesiribacter andamanensis]EMR04653.1 putative decaprenylphosphoryl-beta-D-ribose oxidase [Cesiribacter andamanensis AMV16]
MKKLLANWGQYPALEANELSFRTPAEAAQIVASEEQLIARGAGRCYGDASLAATVLSTLQYNKIRAFDKQQGIFDCQAGITLDEVLEVILPWGWFLPVTPGTKFITVGGAVASDVHGKNHHSDGSFCQHVEVLEVLTASGQVLRCSPYENTTLFETTCGGMGLSGIITRVRFRLKKIETAYIRQTQQKAANLEQIFRLFEENRQATYSVAWIDCLQKGRHLGRSILMLGEHARVDELPQKFRKDPLQIREKKKLSVPFNLPAFTLNSYSIKAFNWAFYHKLRAQQRTDLTDYDTYFYPLDFVHHWNRMYGKRGFVQYQFVLPLAGSYEGLRQILEKISQKGMGSFLAVLKLFGPQAGLLSFPMEGYTLALDFPVRPDLFPFLDELDDTVHRLGGRIYLSKDARMKPEKFLQGYARANEFLDKLQQLDPAQKFVSLQRKRLHLST